MTSLERQREAESKYKRAVTAAANNKKVSAQILADRSQFHARHGNKAAADQDLAQAKELDPSNKEIVGVTARLPLQLLLLVPPEKTRKLR